MLVALLAIANISFEVIFVWTYGSTVDKIPGYEVTDWVANLLNKLFKTVLCLSVLT